MNRLVNQCRAVERRYLALLEHASDVVCVIDARGVLLEVNRRCEEVLQAPRATLVGRPAGDVFRSGLVLPDGTEPGAAGAGDDHSASSRSSTCRIDRADGTSVFLAFSISPLEIDGAPAMLAIGRDMTSSMETARRLDLSERKYRSLVENLPDAVWSATPDLQTTFISPQAATICGSRTVAGEGAILRRLERIDPDHVSVVLEAYLALLTKSRPVDVEYRWQRPDGRWIWMRERAAVVTNADGTIERVDGILSDITERKELEEQLTQAQKMEAVGRLTGGVAHDFNNMLFAILTSSSFLLDSLTPGDARRQDADDIHRAAERAAALTRRLLAFSRKQIIRPVLLDLDALLADMQRMLGRLVGEDVELSVSSAWSAEGPPWIEADPSQIEQVLMNLAVNARDAMPRGGKLSIRTAHVDQIGPGGGGPQALPPGSYVELSVSDTGCGMDAATLRRLFEPFFTTKEPGRGTGLGLSTCLAIVKHSGGRILVDSHLGRGTTFRVYLPRAARPAPQLRAVDRAVPTPPATETVLAIEDCSHIRDGIGRILASHGFRVLLASNAAEAEALAASHPGPIDVVVSDVVMPGPSGPETVRRLQRRYPGLKAVFMSGYSDHPSLRAAEVAGDAFLQKPFAPEALVSCIRNAIGAPRPASNQAR